jgi:hypothetical protein
MHAGTDEDSARLLKIVRIDRMRGAEDARDDARLEA